MDKFKNIFSSQQPEEESSIVNDIWKNSTLSWSTRIKLFIGLFVLGILCSILGSIMFFVLGEVIPFAVLYTIGNIFSIGSTCFLMGPCNQLKKMFASTRLIATIVMIVCMILTLVAAFVLQSVLLVIVFIVLQYLALAWYSISYIPFARDAVKKLCGSILG